MYARITVGHGNGFLYVHKPVLWGPLWDQLYLPDTTFPSRANYSDVISGVKSVEDCTMICHNESCGFYDFWIDTDGIGKCKVMSP